VVDPFFVFFAALFLAATALVILLSVKYLQIEEEQRANTTHFCCLLAWE